MLGREGSSESLMGIVSDAIDVQGRIKPEEVWEYIKKLKISQTKEVVVVQLDPADEEEEVGYVSLFSYFNSRKRCGVLGSKHRNNAVKDMYLVPVSPRHGIPKGVTENYLQGPGADTGVSKDMLVAVVVRSIDKKRKRPASDHVGESRHQKSNRAKEPADTSATPIGDDNDDEGAYSPFGDFDDVGVDIDGPTSSTGPDIGSPYSPTESVPLQTVPPSSQPSLNQQPSGAPPAGPPQAGPQSASVSSVSNLGLDFGAIQSMLKSMNDAKVTVPTQAFVDINFHAISRHRSYICQITALW